MEKVKNNIKMIMGITIGFLIGASTVYALSISANEIKFNSKKADFEAETVADALDILYEEKNDINVDKSNILYSYSQGPKTTNKETSLTLNKGTYIVFATGAHSYSDSEITSHSSKDIEYPYIITSKDYCEQLESRNQVTKATQAVTSNIIIGVNAYDKILLCKVPDQLNITAQAYKSGATDKYTNSIALYAVPIK